MPAETLNCPMCGAPTSTESPACAYCGARLATVACPVCFGMMFIGEKFCSHCGAKAAAPETVKAAPESCPVCRVEMNAVVIGKTNLRECLRCQGLWLDKTSLDQLCADSDQQSAVLVAAPHPPSPPATGTIDQTVRYYPCPVCNVLMNRNNFARCSGVIVDVCAKHGTWFDRDKLRRVVEFIRAGGLEKARANEMDDLERLRERAHRADWQSG